MADSITQLQDAVNELAGGMCNSVGLLQQFAPKSSLDGSQSKSSATDPTPDPSLFGPSADYAKEFAKVITASATHVMRTLDVLPDEDLSKELQVQNASLQQLEEENRLAAERLEAVVEKGEHLLGQIRQALTEIAESQLQTKNLMNGLNSPPNR